MNPRPFSLQRLRRATMFTCAALLLGVWAPAQATLATLRLTGMVWSEAYAPWSLAAGNHSFTLTFVFDTAVPDQRPEDPTAGSYRYGHWTNSGYLGFSAMTMSFDGGPAIDLGIRVSTLDIDLDAGSPSAPYQNIRGTASFEIPGTDGWGSVTVLLRDRHGPADGGDWAVADDRLSSLAGIELADFDLNNSSFLVNPPAASPDGDHPSFSTLSLSSLSVTVAGTPPASQPVPAPLTPALAALGLLALAGTSARRRPGRTRPAVTKAGIRCTR